MTVKYPEVEVQELLKWLVGETFALHEHFEAITVADLMIPYTGTAAGGGTAAVYLNTEPSAIALASNGNNGDGYTLESDRTFSLAALGGKTLIIEFRARINSEADIMFSLGILNATTAEDRVLVLYDTSAGAPVDDGCIDLEEDGGGFTRVAATLASTLDLTVYHKYRLEVEPQAAARLYVDDVLEANETIGANIPPDESWIVQMKLLQKAVGAGKVLYVDYYKVWSR